MSGGAAAARWMRWGWRWWWGWLQVQRCLMVPLLHSEGWWYAADSGARVSWAALAWCVRVVGSPVESEAFY